MWRVVLNSEAAPLLLFGEGGRAELEVGDGVAGSNEKISLLNSPFFSPELRAIVAGS